MTSFDPQPQDDDSVLGGQQLPPIGGLVLGGLAGLERRFEQNDLQEKLTALEQAARHQDGLSLLYRGLEDDNLLVRAEAYIQLKALSDSLDNPPIVLERGISLRVGDSIYGVYRSAIEYGDDWYYLRTNVTGHLFGFYQKRKDSAGKKFDYIYDGYQENNPSSNLITYFIELEAANKKAEAVYLEAFKRLPCAIWEIERAREPEGLDLKAWVETNAIAVEAPLDIWMGEIWAEDGEIHQITEDDVLDLRVIISLYRQKRYDLLREIWERLGYEPLAFVHQHVIDRPCYLRIGEIEK